MKYFYQIKIIVAILMCASLVTISGCEDSTTNPTPPVIEGSILLVASQGDGAMSVIALESGAIIRGATGLGINPNDIIEYQDHIYVINSDSKQLNVLNIMDNNSIEQDTLIELRDENPMQGAVDAIGKMYITNFVGGTVTIYDTQSSQLRSTLFVGQSPDGVRVSNGKVFVCNSGFNPIDFSYAPGTISVMPVDDDFFNVENNISVGMNPVKLDEDSEGRLHVVCTGNYSEVNGRIYIIDTATNEVEQVFDIGGDPLDIAISSNGYGYLTAGGWVDEQPGYVYRYDASTGEILNGPDNPIEVGTGAWNIIADNDGAVYVSCQLVNAVYKIYEDEVVDVINQVGLTPGPMLIYRR